MSIEHIVVGVDGSENARRALSWAVELALALDADVVAVHAVGLLERFGEVVDDDDRHPDVRHVFDTEWCEALETPGVRSVRLLRDGNPVSVLLTVADEHDADLIVVGGRGVGGFPELLLGSTSTQVAQHATRPVTIIPAAMKVETLDD
jgi:nucleotide-binding universal stress UspA family protein